ncbi:MAG: SBBP repeat-containing protein [Nitrospirota bacterium]
MRKLILFFALISFLIPAFSFAQAPQEAWIARYNGTYSHEDAANAIAIDDYGNVYVTGESKGSGSNYDYATIKYNSVGVQQWVARYNGTGNSYDRAFAIAVDANGNVYVTGESKGSGSGYDYATIKYNSVGVQQWVARYNGPINSDDRAHGIALDGNGNVYVTGESKGNSSSLDCATIKYNSNGNQLWVQRYDGPVHYNDAAYAIAVDINANVYVTGESKGNGTCLDYATIKYDTNGNQKWVQRYNNTKNADDSAYAIALDGSGNVYVTGKSMTNTGYYDYATIKYAASGNQLWVSLYNGTGNKDDIAHAIAVDSSDNIYVTGESKGSGTYLDYATVKYNTNGTLVWVARYNGSKNKNDIAHAIALDSSGNVYVTGESRGTSDYPDYLTIKYDTNGNQVWVVSYNGTENKEDIAQAIAVDGNGNVCVTGESKGHSTELDYATVCYAEPSAGISATPTSHDFGPVNVGSPSTAQTFTISNTGTANLVISAIAMTGGDAGMFSAATGGPSPCASLTPTITAGGSCTITATFTPASAGGKSTNLSITSNAPSTPTLVPLSGTGVTVSEPDIRTPIVDIDFGTVNVESCIDRTTTIYNDGTATLTVNNITRLSGSTEFTYIGPATPFTVPAGGSKTVTVRYCPASGSSSAVFNVSSNDPSDPDVTFNVTGQGSPVCTIYVPQDYPTIQQAIDAAWDGCTILVSTGNYVENINFHGKAIRVKGVGTSGPCGCPEEGMSKVSIMGKYNGSVVTFNTGETRNSILEGFTIKNGFATLGGGILIGDASPTILDCYINKNFAYETGGGIYITGNSSSPLIFNTLIVGNFAQAAGGQARGGGIYVTDGASPEIQNCTIADNTSSTPGAGGIHVSSDSAPVITDSIIWRNIPADLTCETGCNMDVTYSDVGAAISGIGNISVDPIFKTGSMGGYYLSHIRAGQDNDSPCIDSGSTTALDSGLDTSNTASDGITDRGRVDMGYHHVPTPVFIQKAWTSKTTYNRGEAITFFITYKIEGNPETLYDVTGKIVAVHGALRTSIAKVGSHYPGLYTMQITKIIPSTFPTGQTIIGYVIMSKKQGETDLIGIDIRRSLITIN